MKRRRMSVKPSVEASLGCAYGIVNAPEQRLLDMLRRGVLTEPEFLARAEALEAQR